MANPFYTPSGNPGTRSDGLSALIRQEFSAVGTGFDRLPAFLTTGSYTTTFNQHGDFTFDLPGFQGTLATIEDVGDEAAVRAAADTANTTAINAEVTARTAAVAAEVSRATAAEGANATAIATEATARTTGDSTNATAIAAETTARTTAITAEATARTTGDSTNATAIAAETTARTTAITAEASARTTGDSTNATAIAAETTRAEAAEAALTLFENTHDETGTRSPGTTYTNSTGKPMVVSITITIFNTGPDMNFYVNNTVTVKLSRLNGVGTAYAIVPDGATYKTDPNTGTNWQGSITTWTETW